MAKLLLGREVTAGLNEKLRRRADELKENAQTVPKLMMIRCGENPADLAYERGAVKRAEATGVVTETTVLPADVSAEELISVIERQNRDDSVHGVLLFRPLPKHLRERESEICNSLVPEKDADCMTDASALGVYLGDGPGYPPCTPQAVLEILDYYGIEPAGRKVCVIGRSTVVGKPVSMMLLKRNATVTICHTKTESIEAVTREADIIVSAAGAAGSLTAAGVRAGQTVIDVSMCWDPAKNGGKGGMTGDALFDEVESAVDAVTPVPGGVGAVTVSVLMEHVISSAEKYVLNLRGFKGTI